MRWIEITIKAKEEAEDSIFNLLKEIGARGVSIEEETKGNLTLIKGYFPEGINIHETLSHIKEGLKLISNYLDLGMEEVEIRYLDEEDWANSWKKYYKPVEIGRVVIVPSWERYEARDKIIINIDPGMAFGTGTHETTILCLLAMEELLKPGMDVIDVGTGSGILAITAKKLGAHRVLAIDIDDIAVKIARENAILNRVNIEIIKNNLIEGIYEKFHLILANINADEIIKLSKDIKRIMRENSYFIASGMIKDRVKDVEKAFEENNLKVIDIREKNSWFLILSRKRD